MICLYIFTLYCKILRFPSIYFFFFLVYVAQCSHSSRRTWCNPVCDSVPAFQWTETYQSDHSCQKVGFTRDESFSKKQDMYLPFISGLYKQSIVLGYTVPQVVKASSYLWGSCLSGSVGGFFFGRCSGCIMMLWECSEVTQGILDEEEALGEIL